MRWIEERRSCGCDVSSIFCFYSEYPILRFGGLFTNVIAMLLLLRIPTMAKIAQMHQIPYTYVRYKHTIRTNTWLNDISK